MQVVMRLTGDKALGSRTKIYMGNANDLVKE
jgi:hypothetical protein